MRSERAYVCARSAGFHSRCAAGMRCVSLAIVRFPCFGWCFKPTFWTQTKRERSANKPQIVTFSLF